MRGAAALLLIFLLVVVVVVISQVQADSTRSGGETVGDVLGTPVRPYIVALQQLRNI